MTLNPMINSAEERAREVTEIIIQLVILNIKDKTKPVEAIAKIAQVLQSYAQEEVKKTLNKKWEDTIEQTQKIQEMHQWAGRIKALDEAVKVARSNIYSELNDQPGFYSCSGVIQAIEKLKEKT